MNFDLLVPRSGFWRPTPAGKSPLTVVSCARQPFKPQQMLVPSAKAFVGTFRHFSDSLMHTHRSFTIYGLQIHNLWITSHAISVGFFTHGHDFFGFAVYWKSKRKVCQHVPALPQKIDHDCEAFLTFLYIFDEWLLRLFSAVSMHPASISQHDKRIGS